MFSGPTLVTEVFMIPMARLKATIEASEASAKSAAMASARSAATSEKRSRRRVPSPEWTISVPANTPAMKIGIGRKL